MKTFIKKWWNDLRYEPGDPRNFTGGSIKIAVIGGGTGLATLLRGLKKYSNNISAIVVVTDDGASSGAIRKEFDILPPGDIRKCISALAYDEGLISNIMEYRFSDGKSMGGHTLGNIWITALSKYYGSFEKAIEATTEIFQTAGKVLPSTLDDLDLCAEYEDGSHICGESKIPRPGQKIKRVYLSRKNIRVYQRAAEAILKADLIIFGPGSLYTSVIPNLLIRGIREALRENMKAVNIFVCNCSTERGETEGYSALDHIEAIYDHCGGKAFDHCLVNNRIIKRSVNASLLGNINNITTSKNEFNGCAFHSFDLVNEKNPLYHDSDKLAKAVIELYNRVKK